LSKIELISTFKHVGCRKYSFQNLKGFSQGNNVLDAAAPKGWFPFERYMGFFNSAEEAYLEETKQISGLKHLSCRKNSFQKLTEF
jgi:hypothetical protein